MGTYTITATDPDNHDAAPSRTLTRDNATDAARSARLLREVGYRDVKITPPNAHPKPCTWTENDYARSFSDYLDDLAHT